MEKIYHAARAGETMNENEDIPAGLPVRASDGQTHIVRKHHTNREDAEVLVFFCGESMMYADIDLTKTVGKFRCQECEQNYLRGL